MPEPATARIVLTTTATPDDARRLGRLLVEERLAACATLLPAMESIYHWDGKIEAGDETLLLLKTEQQLVAALEERLHANHPYRTPEFLVLAVEAGSAAYLAWMRSCLGAS